MKHNEINTGVLRSYLDDELGAEEASAVRDHLGECSACRTQLESLQQRATSVRTGLDHLPQFSGNASRGWALLQHKREEWEENGSRRWLSGKTWWLAAGACATAAFIVVLTVGPVRAWAENLLAVFRVERFTVLELNPVTNPHLENNQVLNQAISHLISDDVVITEAPQKAQVVADAATASRLAAFHVKLLTNQSPSSLVLMSGEAMRMKLDRDRLQGILNEAGRNDLRIPESVDGANISLRIPPGVIAAYGNCGNIGPATKEGNPKDNSDQRPDASCIHLMELPSPVFTAPAGFDPAQIAQVGLQFAGMSANDAANFTQTVDWTSTLVIPVPRGQSSYQQIPVNGNDGVLLRPKRGTATGSFVLAWSDAGIIYVLRGNGDDTTALNLAAQLD